MFFFERRNICVTGHSAANQKRRKKSCKCVEGFSNINYS
jgi:hypothetical protein